MTDFDTLLIANRGEIACRIMRTAKAMGLRTVAVYSDADKDAPHVKRADISKPIGGLSAAESYLDINKIIAASEPGWAIHPGYGFLSENAEFAQAVADANMIFIGPPPQAITLMGDKAQAKRRMIAAGVPVVPGYQGKDQADDILLREAARIGTPLMVKAAAGGGGRGLRRVDDLSGLMDHIHSARSEALNAFGSDTLILERCVIRPRHVEVQVFADTHGNIIHLGERDCSVQRRHQKVIEEAPCPVMTPALRNAMGQAAVKAARDVNYVGAGTVEFMLDETGEFYFLEMNTRLQVEHPVTELITNLDLVAWQIRVARGERLPLSQADVEHAGHAIEARLYAENPGNDFLPATGQIDMWLPPCGDGIRVDSGIAQGDVVSPFYDPMLAKIIAFGPDRETARLRLHRALQETVVQGVTTNRAFLITALDKDEFKSGEATTDFIETQFQADNFTLHADAVDLVSAAVLLFRQRHQQALEAGLGVSDELLNWSSATQLPTPFEFDGTRVDVVSKPLNRYDVTLGDRTYSVSCEAKDVLFNTLRIDGQKRRVVARFPDVGLIRMSTDRHDIACIDTLSRPNITADMAGGGTVIAPMHGALLELRVTEGDTVSRGQTLAVLEAMKMQHPIRAAINGTVQNIRVTAGQQLAANAVLMTLKDASEDTPQ